MADTWAPFLAFEGINGAIDRNGIETVTVAYYISTFEEAREWIPADILPVIGLPLRRVRQMQQEWGNGALIREGKDGAYKVTFTFEGIRNAEQTFGFEEERGVEFSADVTMEEADARTHPAINFIMKKYLGTLDENGTLVFEPTVPWGGAPEGQAEPALRTGSLQTGRLGPPSFDIFGDYVSELPGAGYEVTNPLLGWKKYRKPGLVWSKTYAALRVKSSVTQNIGRVETPPADSNGYRPDIHASYGHKNWLKVAGLPVLRGNVYSVTEAWESGDWVQDVYR